MLRELHAELAGRGIALRIVGAHGSARDLLRAEGARGKSRRVRPYRDTRQRAARRFGVGVFSGRSMDAAQSRKVYGQVNRASLVGPA